MPSRPPFVSHCIFLKLKKKKEELGFRTFYNDKTTGFSSLNMDNLQYVLFFIHHGRLDHIFFNGLIIHVMSVLEIFFFFLEVKRNILKGR